MALRTDEGKRDTVWGKKKEEETSKGLAKALQYPLETGRITTGCRGNSLNFPRKTEDSHM